MYSIFYYLINAIRRKEYSWLSFELFLGLQLKMYFYFAIYLQTHISVQLLLFPIDTPLHCGINLTPTDSKAQI